MPTHVVAAFAMAVVAAHPMTTRASARIGVGNEDHDYENCHLQGRKDPSASFHPSSFLLVRCSSAFFSPPDCA
jgi:hypothetical protein